MLKTINLLFLRLLQVRPAFLLSFIRTFLTCSSSGCCSMRRATPPSAPSSRASPTTRARDHAEATRRVASFYPPTVLPSYLPTDQAGSLLLKCLLLSYLPTILVSSDQAGGLLLKCLTSSMSSRKRTRTYPCCGSDASYSYSTYRLSENWPNCLLYV